LRADQLSPRARNYDADSNFVCRSDPLCSIVTYSYDIAGGFRIEPPAEPPTPEAGAEGPPPGSP
jgi:hypothetical protein